MGHFKWIGVLKQSKVTKKKIHVMSRGNIERRKKKDWSWKWKRKGKGRVYYSICPFTALFLRFCFFTFFFSKKKYLFSSIQSTVNFIFSSSFTFFFWPFPDPCLMLLSSDVLLYDLYLELDTTTQARIFNFKLKRPNI